MGRREARREKREGGRGREGNIEDAGRSNATVHSSGSLALRMISMKQFDLQPSRTQFGAHAGATCGAVWGML